MPRKKQATSSAPERVKRPVLPRTQPIRAWPTIFGPQKSNGANGSNGASAHQSKPGDDKGDAVQRGVKFGYKVIDEYVRQGAAAAGSFAKPDPARTPSGEDLPKMTERMMQYASDFTSVWFDAMGIMLGNANGRTNGAPSTSRNKSNARKNGANQAPEESPTRCVFEVKSEQPAEIIVSLDSSPTSELVVEPLRVRTKGRAITDVTIKRPEPGAPLRLRVHVPKGLAPGRYTGAVLDSGTRQQRGRLTVVLRSE